MSDNLIKDFYNPPVENRPRPFWFFNGDMDRDEVRHQITEMKNKGLGGFFICARQGLRIPYLSKEWFDLCKYTVDTAKEMGLEVWLYDEYPYPSGMSGGEVTILHPEAKSKIMELRLVELGEGESLNESLGEGSLVCAHAWPVVNGTVNWKKVQDISAHTGILQNQEIYQKTEGGASYRHNFKRYFTYGPSKEIRWTPAPNSAWRVLIAFTKDIDDFKYYGTYLDPINEKAVQAFIDTTYEPYKKALGSEFGKTIKGMFGDETAFHGPWPWSPDFPAYYSERFGEALVENLSALLDSSYPNSARIRYQYYQCVHELLRDRYHKPLSEWCEKNNIHYVTEIPSVRMSNQMYSHVPGGDPCHDKLGYPFDMVVDRDFHVLRSNPKAISAMARQFNRRDCIVESFHSIGWTKTLQDVKWQTDRQTLMGITLHNFHAYFYTLNGITKHDAPPSQFLQNPYWEYYKSFTDYCGRSSRFLTETEASISVAVLHPAISWCTELRHPFMRFEYIGTDPKEGERGRALVDDYKYICKTLFFNQTDYEDLDPEVMAMGEIRDGAIHVGKARYTVLIVPPITCIERYAFDLIRKFLEAGGKVIFTGLTPFRVIEDGFNPLSDFEDADLGTLTSELYYGAAGKAEMKQKQENLFLLEAPGGLRASNAGNKLGKLITSFNLHNSEIIIPSQLPEKLKEGLIIHRREKDDVHYIMIASQNGAAADTKVIFKNVPQGAAFYELDFDTGTITAVKADNGADGSIIDAPLSPWSARLFAMAKSEVKTSPKMTPVQIFTRPPEKTLRLTLELDKKLPVSIQGQNVYRLEEMKVSIEGCPPFATKPNTFVEHLKESGQINAALIKFGDGFGTPQRMALNYPALASYRYEFFMDRDLFSPAKGIRKKIMLMRDKMGIMGGYTMIINKKELPSSSWIPYRLYDQNNIACDVSSMLKPGLNVINVNVTATEDWHGISDPMYLLGDFGVLQRDGKFVMGKTISHAVPSAKTVEGYPFYSGKFIFETEIAAGNPAAHELFTIELPEKYRIYECVELSVNGQPLGARTFSPYIWQGQAKILKEGVNTIKLSIANTLANMLEASYFNYESQRTNFIGKE